MTIIDYMNIVATFISFVKMSVPMLIQKWF